MLQMWAWMKEANRESTIWTSEPRKLQVSQKFAIKQKLLA